MLVIELIHPAINQLIPSEGNIKAIMRPTQNPQQVGHFRILFNIEYGKTLLIHFLNHPKIDSLTIIFVIPVAANMNIINSIIVIFIWNFLRNLNCYNIYQIQTLKNM